MTPKSVERLKNLGMSKRRFAIINQISENMVERWGTGHTDEPRWVERQLTKWEQHPATMLAAMEAIRQKIEATKPTPVRRWIA